MGNQVCRYTMLTRPPEPMCSLASLGASGAAKMPFYEAADHACHRSSTIHEPRELMDRVRRCTGEMFQPTRLKGRTVNTLAPLSLSFSRYCPRARSVSLCCCCPFIPSRIQPRAAPAPRLPLADTARAPLFVLVLVAFIFLSASFFSGIRCIPCARATLETTSTVIALR